MYLSGFISGLSLKVFGYCEVLETMLSTQYLAYI